jgi:Flp pilus assembly protein TadG
MAGQSKYPQAGTAPRRRGLLLAFRRLRRDRRGVAAVEFAMIVPILLLLYLGTMEISSGVSLNKRVARVAVTAADLVTQQSEVDRKTLEGIMEIGASILFPYYADTPRITIAGIDVDEDHPEGGQVVWARRMNKDGSFETGWTAGNFTWVPERLRIDDTFVVMVRVDLVYLPLITWVTDRDADGTPLGIDMSETYWFHPRLVEEIDCTNC